MTVKELISSSFRPDDQVYLIERMGRGYSLTNRDVTKGDVILGDRSIVEDVVTIGD